MVLGELGSDMQRMKTDPHLTTYIKLTQINDMNV